MKFTAVVFEFLRADRRTKRRGETITKFLKSFENTKIHIFLHTALTNLIPDLHCIIMTVNCLLELSVLQTKVSVCWT